MHGSVDLARLRYVGVLTLLLLLLGLAVSTPAQASTTSKLLYALGSYNSDRGRAYTVCGLTVSQRTTPQVGRDDIAMTSAVDCTTGNVSIYGNSILFDNFGGSFLNPNVSRPELVRGGDFSPTLSPNARSYANYTEYTPTRLKYYQAHAEWDLSRYGGGWQVLDLRLCEGSYTNPRIKCNLGITFPGEAEDLQDGRSSTVAQIQAIQQYAEQLGGQARDQILAALAQAQQDAEETLAAFQDDPTAPSNSPDMTAPAAASEVALSHFDATSASAEISWEPGEDPNMAADVSGSGIRRQEARTRKPGQQWSAWGSAVDDAIQLAGVSLGTDIDVEVRAVDENGNFSASVNATVAITPTPSPGEDDVVRAPVGPGSGELTYNVDVLVDGDLADTDEGFRVQLERPDGSRVVDETREDGTALFRGLVPGTYTVRAIGLSDDPEMVTRAQQVDVPANGQQQIQARAAVSLEDVCAAFADGLSAAGVLSDADEFKQEYCFDPTAAEYLFCVKHPRLCMSFQRDAAKAYGMVPYLFDTTRAKGDATKANSFQHSYWTARMVRTVIKTTILDHVDYALDFATAHESEARVSDDPVMRKRSTMDRHNNQVGFDFASQRAKKHNNTFLCNRMRAKVKLGRIGPSKARVDQLYWLLPVDTTGQYVHLRDRRCQNAADGLK